MAKASFPSCFLPDPTTTRLTALTVHPDQHSCTLDLQTTPSSSSCPQCQQPATRVHSRYTRRFADLPLATVAVQIVLQTRRFFCDQPACPQRIFTERLPSVVPPRGRRTNRLAVTHQQLALAVSGNGGARLGRTLGMAIGRDLLIKDIRALLLPSMPPATVIGIDDWAIRKGQTYGTIVVDLETHRTLDLLPDRTADTVAAWLEAHPTITHLSRDRAVAYGDAAWRGAPQAQQIADRWHLLKNMSDALIAVCDGYQRAIAHAVSDRAVEASPPSGSSDPEPGAPPAPQSSAPLLPPTSREQRHTTMHHLHALGWTQRAIAAQVGLHLKTVGRHLRSPADAVPQHVPR